MNLPIRLSAPILILACLSQAAAIAQQRPSQPGPSRQRTVSEALAWEADPAFVSTHFSGAANCAACHDDLVDEAGQDVSIQHDWSATMMAHAARDPVFQAKFASEVKRNPVAGTRPRVQVPALSCADGVDRCRL